MAALQDIHAALATKAYPDHLHYKLSLRYMDGFLSWGFSESDSDPGRLSV